MSNYRYDSEYMKLINHILENKEFSKLDEVKHHGGSRMYHSIKVSYYSYKIAKALRLDYDQVARAGLLHDFFEERTIHYNKPKDKFLLYTTKHPVLALKNAEEHFNITAKEADMIVCHMFPFDFRIPKYAESWIVNLVDTCVSTSEFVKKFKYQISYAMNLYLLLLFNTLK